MTTNDSSSGKLQGGEEPRLRKDAELEHLRHLPTAAYDKHSPVGVLLSDEILKHVRDSRMIEPFVERKLKPAAYELSVGELYSIGGKTYTLSPEVGKNEIVIRPFEVVVIQTLERLNLPAFLIGRWNLRVRWAYEGLLWVGGPQVDPGFKGYLACPLYNLSDKDVRLKYGEEIAVIDFITTTPPNAKSKPYPALSRSRILFEEYNPENLRSALATRAEQKIQAFDLELKELSKSVRDSVAIIFTAIGILVAVLALFVGRQIPESLSYFSPALLVSAVAITISLIALAGTSRPIRSDPNRFWVIVLLQAGALLLLLLIMAQLFLSGIGDVAGQLRADLYRQERAREERVQSVEDRFGDLERRMSEFRQERDATKGNAPQLQGGSRSSPKPSRP